MKNKYLQGKEQTIYTICTGKKGGVNVKEDEAWNRPRNTAPLYICKAEEGESSEGFGSLSGPSRLAPEGFRVRIAAWEW